MLTPPLICVFICGYAHALLGYGVQTQPLKCKPRYGSSEWPTPAAWQQLNTSLSGRLVSPTPPGAVCHHDMITYNNASCEVVLKQWTNTSFHALNLVSTDYNDVACLPDSTSPCTLDNYPRYVVPARDVQDFQHAINFARDTGVRLIVKGTGHDVPGRSSGSDSLSIQTHNMRGLRLYRRDPRALALGGVASLKIQAGERMEDIYKLVAANDLTVVGGGEPHVGIGGWISHGGHGPVSAHYGLGSDQVLEMEVVTADGVLRTVNETSEADLFWALRGGGASNFAVIASVTVKAYGVLPYTNFNFAYNTTANSDTFWTMAAYFHSKIPHLVKSGLMGYFWVTPFDSTGQNGSVQGTIYGRWFAPELSLTQVQQLLKPIEERINARALEDPVFTTGVGEEFNDFTKGFATKNPPDTAGIPVRLGSRLLDKSALSRPLSEIESTLRSLSNTSFGWPILGHVIAGTGTWNPMGGIVGGSNAVLPAWRKAVMQIALPRSWEPLNTTQKAIITTQLRTEEVQALRDLAPDMGAYANEADPTEPNWQETFYGEHYPRLLKLKKRWDPHGVFWYKNGVGSELWEPKGPHGIENGVGQSPVQLCKAEGYI